MVDVHGGCRESGDAIEDEDRQQMESATRYIPSWATATLKYGAGTLGNRKMHLQDGGTVTMMKSTSFSCAAKRPQQGGGGLGRYMQQAVKKKEKKDALLRSGLRME